MLNDRKIIMCLTPLQMLIAEKIIEQDPKSKFDVIVSILNDNEKYKLYSDRLARKVENFLIFKPKECRNKPLLMALDVLRFSKQLKKAKFKKVYAEYYLASCDYRYFQYIVNSRSADSRILTFDDGTANIYKKSLYFSNLKPRWINRFFWSFFGIKEYMAEIFSKSFKHYTIYRNFENVVKNVEVIDLFKLKSENNIREEEINIFLGQPFCDFGFPIEHKYLEDMLKKLKIDFYFKHPREKGFFDIPYIETNLIFEDYVIDFLKEKNNTKINLYTFTSSAALNVLDVSGVNVFFLKNKLFEQNLFEFYEMLEENSVKILNIP